MGKSLREKCPCVSHAAWQPAADRPDPVSLVLKADEGRVPELLPLRHGRMVLSPFTFYRGSALAMAVDLAATPATGVRVQCGGDSHLVNFRGLATPERQVIFAINDLDETLPAPWEWDLKRLAASFVIACRDNGLSEADAKNAALTCVRSYREHMAEFNEMAVLDLWYYAVEAEMLISTIDDPAIRRGQSLALSHARSGDAAVISGYLGKSDVFDEAVAAFSVAYADQNEKDHAVLKRAIQDGKIEALIEEPK